MSRVIVLGAGLAGLSAALKLTDAGCQVTLIESRPQAGGRAFSFIDRLSTDLLDNGQHVVMSCHPAVSRYLQRIGSSEMLREVPVFSLDFRHTDGRNTRLRTASLPGSFGMLSAILRYRMLPLRDRIGIIHATAVIRRLKQDAADFLHTIDCLSWLRSLRQSEKAIEYFWEPVIVATLNARPHHAAAGYLYIVLREVFFSEKAVDILLPEPGLSEVFIRPALGRLTGAGTNILLHQTVEGLVYAEGRIAGVRLKNGEFFYADNIVSALPPWALTTLLPDHTAVSELRSVIGQFVPSTILSLHVWLRRDPALNFMTGALGSEIHWLFAKPKSADGSWRISCTISASSALLRLSSEELQEQLIHELLLLLPKISKQDILRILPLHEKRATFIPVPGIENLRPPQRSALPGFYLAGDWTATGLPATIEGALLSGEYAAEAILTDMEKY